MCCGCNKTLCYLYNKCKTIIHDLVCGDCFIKDRSDIHRTPLLSQIITQCDREKEILVNDLFPELSKFNANKSDFDELRPCFKFQKLHLTHLDSEKYNIFYPNERTSEPINGIFRSLSLLKKLVGMETQGRVCDELFNFYRYSKF